VKCTALSLKVNVKCTALSLNVNVKCTALSPQGECECTALSLEVMLFLLNKEVFVLYYLFHILTVIIKPVVMLCTP